MSLNDLKTVLKSNKVTSFLYDELKSIRIRINANKFQESNKKLTALRGMYAGRRCFIIGNGPSLSSQDLERLKKEVCIASNRIFIMYNRTTWRPEIYTAQDEVIIQESYEDIRKINSKLKFLIVPESASPYDIDAIYLKKRLSEISHSVLPKFSEDVRDVVYEGYSIVYTNIQLAVFLGFSEIYLLGVDHNYSVQKNMDGSIQKNTNVKNYFDEAYSKKDFGKGGLNIPRTEETTRAFMSAQNYASNHSIKIYNATRGGKLEVFPRVNFDDIPDLN